MKHTNHQNPSMMCSIAVAFLPRGGRGGGGSGANTSPPICCCVPTISTS